jgi:glycosyltransferase involved in cell wall biosynthesis
MAKVRRRLDGPPDPEKPRRDDKTRKMLRDAQVDLVFCLYPSEIGFASGLPFAMVVPDLQHRLNPQFPEVSEGGEAARREYVFRNGIREARSVLVDSYTGKEDVLTFYGGFGLDPQRIDVLPFLTPPYLPSQMSKDEIVRVRDRYRLPEAYIFYPAQLWPHKNHLRLIEALGVLHRQGVEIPLVLCGSHEGELRNQTFDVAMRRAQEVGVADLVRYVGYVPDSDMAGLYAGATALVFPTFFGPTNIPVLEAWQLGCPVITSDIRGIREQVGDAGLLVDPESVDAIAEGIRHVWTNPGLRRTLAGSGHDKLEEYTWPDFESDLHRVLERLRAEVQGGETG